MRLTLVIIEVRVTEIEYKIQRVPIDSNLDSRVNSSLLMYNYYLLRILFMLKKGITSGKSLIE